jgi:hypothetical protein
MVRSLALGAVLLAGVTPARADVLSGLRAGTAGTAERLARATLIGDAPPRGGYGREMWVFRHTQRGFWDAIIADAAAQEGIDPFLLKGLLLNESQLNPRLVGKRSFAVVRGKRRVISGGARGIAQLTSAGIDAVNELREKRGIARPFTPSEVMVPEKAIPAAAALLGDYMDRFGRDGGITAYNTGPTGGKLVRDRGFRGAVKETALHRHGAVVNQGGHFLPHVLTKTNKLRRGAGLEPLEPIGKAPPFKRRPTTS